MRNGSTRWIGILAGVIALAVATPALAQEQGMRHGHDPEKRIEKLREALDLTDEQVVQVRAILAEHGEEIRALRESEDREGLRALHQEMHGRLSAILDDAQREKLEALHARHKEHRGEHGRGHDEGHDDGDGA